MSEINNREQNGEKPWEDKGWEGKTNQTKKMTDLCETRAALSRAKLTRSTLTDTQTHTFPHNFSVSLNLVVWTQARALAADNITHPTRHTVIPQTANHYRTESAVVVKHFVGGQRWVAGRQNYLMENLLSKVTTFTVKPCWQRLCMFLIDPKAYCHIHCMIRKHVQIVICSSTTALAAIFTYWFRGFLFNLTLGEKRGWLLCLANIMLSLLLRVL